MKVAIIGTGFTANLHAKEITALGHKITVAINKNLEKAAQFAHKWQIEKYGNTLELALENCDCIHICTPPIAHFELAKAAILAGKHIICEKPLCIDPKKAKKLLELAESKNIIAAVNFNIRYHEVCQLAKNHIKKAEFGPIRLIHGSYLQEFHAESDFYSWRYRSKEGGKMRATTEIGSHWIDLVRYWTGLEIRAVSAHFANFQPTRYLTNDGIIHSKKMSHSKKIIIDSEDVATIFFKFDNGAIGNVVLSEIAHGKKNQLQLEVTGQKQAIWWNNEKPYHLHIGQKNKGIITQSNPFGGGFEDTFRRLFKAVYTHIEHPENSAHFPTFKDGYINALISHSIFESANNESIWVNIPVIK